MKSSLGELYQFSESARNLGIELSPDQIELMRFLEDNLIRQEVVPVIKKQLQPVLNRIRRPLSISLDYRPGSEIDVKIIRNDEANGGNDIETIQRTEEETTNETVAEPVSTSDNEAQNNVQTSRLEYNLEELSRHDEERDTILTNRKPNKLKIGDKYFDVKDNKDAYIQVLKYLYALDGEKMRSFIVTGIPGVEKPDKEQKRFRSSGETCCTPYEIADGLWVSAQIPSRNVIKYIIQLLEPYGIDKKDCVIYLSDYIGQKRGKKESK